MKAQQGLAPTLYLSGASREHERVAAIADKLERSRLVRITHRWFDDAAQWVGRDHELTLSQARGIGEAEETAIRTARMFWLLWPQNHSAGAFIEYGYARAHRFHSPRTQTLIVSGEGCESSLFTADVAFRSRIDALALEVVLDLACKQLSPELLTQRAWQR